MARFLLIVIILLSTFYLVPITSVSAEEITPTLTFLPQANPTGSNPVADFINSLIPQMLTQVNCANLPSSVCTDIKPADVSVNTTTGGPKTQDAGNTTDTKAVAGNAAGQYIVASGIHTPPEVANASTDIISGIITAVGKFFDDLFNQGEKQAKNYAGTALPQDVSNQNFAREIQNISGFVSGDSNVLGAQMGQPAMDRALPLVQCGALPAGLCSSDNKPNSIQ